MSEAVLTKLIENGAAAAVPALLMAILFGAPIFWVLRRLVDAIITSLREMVDHVANLAKAQESCSLRHSDALAAHSAQATQIQASILEAIRDSQAAQLRESRDNHREIMALLRGENHTATKAHQEVKS